MIESKSLSRMFGDYTAVSDMSFSAKKGEVLGFLGPNGAGKSTTMKMLTCFLTPSGGTATVAGFDILENPIEVQKKIGYLPENAPLYGEMTVSEFLKFVCDVRGLSASVSKVRYDTVVEQTSLSRVLNQRIETLSKGYKRRVGLAQSIIHDPEVLILDEPTDGLDPNQKHEVRKLIHGMSKEKCIIVSTHILEEVDAICSRAVIISKGKIVADGTPVELKRRSSGKGSVVFDFSSADIAKNASSYLSELSSVASLTLDDSRITLHPKHSKIEIMREGLFVLSQKNIQVLDAYSEEAQLDEVFRSVTVSHQS